MQKKKSPRRQAGMGVDIEGIEKYIENLIAEPGKKPGRIRAGCRFAARRGSGRDANGNGLWACRKRAEP